MLKIKNMNSNNVIRQGDSQPRGYQLDTGNLNLNLANKRATIRLMTGDYKGVAYEATATVGSENKISFRIEDVIPAREYRLEITVDDYVFPSRALDGQFNIDPSSHGQEVNIINVIGKEEIVRDVKARVENELEPLVTSLESAQQSELDRQAQEEAREETHEKVKDLPEAFQNVIDETTGKDVISAPEIIAARRGKASLGEKIDEVDTQLAQTNKKFTNIISITDFPRLGSETDDTQRFQRAIDSFEGNVAGTIVIPYDIHVSSQVTCNKTGLRIVGLNNKVSRIISSSPDKTLHIEPLFNGHPYTNAAYCKFYMDNIAIVAEGDARETGTGLFLQWLYASSFLNLMTLGFKKHIVLRGCHLNTFYNLFQGNYTAEVQGEEIHNRGVGLSADGILDDVGESASNNNSIIGGWINNTSWDLRGLELTTIQGVDFEPQSNTLYLGSQNTLRNCRLERFDSYAPTEYDYFPWIVMDDSNLIEHCTFHNAGPNNLPNRNPVLTINGNDNEIFLKKNQYSFSHGFIRINEQAEHNLIYDKSVFTDNRIGPGYYSDMGYINSYNPNNTLITTDPHSGNEVTINTDRAIGKGCFTNYVPKNTSLFDAPYYYAQGGTLTAIDIPLPTGRKTDEAFVKFTLTESSGNRRMLIHSNYAIAAPKTGIYTLNMMMFIPNDTNGKVQVRPNITYQPKELYIKDKWFNVQSRFYIEEGEIFEPTISFSGLTGESIYFGELSVCEGNNAIYIENDTTTSKSVVVGSSIQDVNTHEGLLNEATGTRLKYWAGSQAEYDAIGTYDLETVYDIW